MLQKWFNWQRRILLLKLRTFFKVSRECVHKWLAKATNLFIGVEKQQQDPALSCKPCNIVVHVPYCVLVFIIGQITCGDDRE